MKYLNSSAWHWAFSIRKLRTREIRSVVYLATRHVAATVTRRTCWLSPWSRAPRRREIFPRNSDTRTDHHHLRVVGTRKSDNLVTKDVGSQIVLTSVFETRRNCHARRTNRGRANRRFGASSRRVTSRPRCHDRGSLRVAEHSEVNENSFGATARRAAYARERCVQIELAPRNAGTDSRDRHGETEKRQRRAHARHAYCSEPSQSRSRPLSVAPATRGVAHRVSLARCPVATLLVTRPRSPSPRASLRILISASS